MCLYRNILLSSLTTGELLGFRDIEPSLQHYQSRSITPRNGYGRLCTMVANCLRWRACGFVIDDVSYHLATLLTVWLSF